MGRCASYTWLSFILAGALLAGGCVFTNSKVEGTNTTSLSFRSRVNLASEAYTQALWARQPAYGFYKAGVLDRGTQDTVTLKAYAGGGCTGAELPGLSNPRGTYVATGGVADFFDVSYTLSTALEESIYVQGVAVGTGLTSCSGPIDILHKFNTTGTVLFQDGGNGAGGASNATKEDFVYGYEGIQIDAQGRYVIVGQTLESAGSGYSLALWRYNPNGTLDTTFAGGAGYTVFQPAGAGMAGAAYGAKDDEMHALAIDSDGKIIITGRSKNAAGGYEMVLTRYNSNGTLDTTFGSLGYVMYNAGGTGAAGELNAIKVDDPYSVKIDSQGRYVVVGHSRNTSGRNTIAIWRYNYDGSIDTTFGQGATTGLGYVLYNAGSTGVAGAANGSKSDSVYGFVIDSSGRYLISGTSRNAAGGYEAYLMRYNSDGSLDTTFGAGTGYTIFYGSSNRTDGAVGAAKFDIFFGITEDSEGRIIAGGNSKNSANGKEILLARYTRAGVLDSTFGDGATAGLGYVIFNANGVGISGRPNATKIDFASKPFIDRQGRYVIAHSSYNAAGSYEPYTARYLSTGALDTTYGTSGGYSLVNPGAAGVAGAANGSKWDVISSVILDKHDRMIGAGSSYNADGGAAMMLVRWNSSGIQDF
jgi:uncharacterized delta-60 repeat protein